MTTTFDNYKVSLDILMEPIFSELSACHKILNDRGRPENGHRPLYDLRDAVDIALSDKYV